MDIILSGVIVRNITVIGLTLVTFTVLMLILKWGLNQFFGLGEKLAARIRHFLIFRGSLFILEILMLMMFGLLIFFHNKPLVVVTIMIVTFLIAIIGAEVREAKPNAFSLFKLLPVFFNKDIYLVNRVSLFMDESTSVMTLIVALIVTFTFFTSLKWPDKYYFVFFIVLPAYSAFWVYFDLKKLKLRLNHEDSINIRRLVAYTFLAIYTCYDLYSKFTLLMNNQKLQDLNLTSFFYYSATVMFIALERVLKTLTDDYKKFKQQAKKHGCTAKELAS